MSKSFKAFRIHAPGKFERAAIEQLTLDDLSPGEVVIKVEYSSVNYKDALAGTGAGAILRKSPLVGGIDLAGKVHTSTHSSFEVGQPVLVNGSGLSEVHDGGFAEYARVPADWVIPIPDGLDSRSAMIIGTAGFTAGMALQRLLDNHQSPELGPILVTGATGGVGSFAIHLLSQQGFQVTAMTRKSSAVAYLKELGASQVIGVEDIESSDTMLLKGQWGGAIDNLGGDTLGWLLKTIKPWGNVVSIGMAAGAQFGASTMPFILRGVGLLGVTSANCPYHVRKEIWDRLATDWRPAAIDRICAEEVSLDNLPQAFARLLSGDMIGRQLVCLDAL